MYKKHFSQNPASECGTKDFRQVGLPSYSKFGIFCAVIAMMAAMFLMPAYAEDYTGLTMIDKSLWTVYINVYTFKRSDVLESEIPSDAKRVDMQLSTYKVYEWRDTGSNTWYWWSDDTVVYLPEDSSGWFKLKQSVHDLYQTSNYLRTIDLTGLNFSYVTNMSEMFANCTRLEDVVGIESISTRNVTNMSKTFYQCQSIPNFDLSSWDVSNVTDMSNMFNSCNSALTSVGSGGLNLTGWDTSSVTDMSYMFYNCYKIVSVDALSNWDTSSVTNMSFMFSYLTVIVSVDALSNWDTSSVKNMSFMFDHCYKIVSVDALSNWDTSNVTDMSNMFSYCENLININGISSWDPSSATDMSYMFYDCQHLANLDSMSSWNVSNVEKMSRMFAACDKIANFESISNWNTGNVTHMDGMFAYNTTISSLAGLSDWDTSNVVDMSEMFTRCTSLVSLNELSNWDTGNVSNAAGMFAGCSKLANIDGLSAWSFGSNVNLSSMFNSCHGLTSVSALNSWDTSNVTNISYIFSSCTNLTDVGNIKIWNTSNITNMSDTFYRCESLTSLDLDGWDTSNVVNMRYIFSKCIKLESISGLDSWDTGSVVDMSSAFEDCYCLNSLDLSNWNTSSVTTMSRMFYAAFCYNDATINVSGWDTSDVEKMDYMFANCNKVTDIIGVDNWNTSNVWKMEYTFSGCKSLTKLNLSGWDTSRVTTICNMFSSCQSLAELDISRFNTKKITNAKDANAFPTVAIRSVKLGPKYFASNYMAMPTIGSAYKGWQKVGGDGTIYTNSEIRSNWDEETDPGWWTLGGIAPGQTMIDEILWNQNKYKGATSFVRSNLDESGLPENIVRVDAGFSNYKIYTWYDSDSKTWYWWSDDTVVYLPPDSKEFFMSGYYGYSLFTNLDLRDWKSDYVTNMSYMFANCGTLVNLDLRGWNTSNVTNMAETFYTCYSLNDVKGIEDWDTSKVTNLEGTFYHCVSLRDVNCLSDWDTSSVTNMAATFFECKLITDFSCITNWNVDNVTTMQNMFQSCLACENLDLSGWNTSKTTNMMNMFYGCNNLQRITLGPAFSFKGKNITNTSAQALLVQPESPYFDGWAKVGDENGTVYSNTSLRDNWNADFAGTWEWHSQYSGLTMINKGLWTRRTDLKYFVRAEMEESELPTNANRIDARTSNFKIYEWGDTSSDTWYWWSNDSIIYMPPNSSKMFYYCYKLITATGFEDWNSSKVETMESLFTWCESLKTISDISNWDTSSVTDMSDMFYNCSALTSLDLSGWDTSKVTNMNLMFDSCNMTSVGDISGWDVSNVTTMERMFCYCRSITNLDLSRWDINNVTSMISMFSHCSKLESLDIGGWDTSHVTNMNGLFSSCSSLTELDLSGWDTSNVTNMNYMFDDCSKLKSLDIGGWNTSNVTDMNFMFRQCSKLKTITLGQRFSFNQAILPSAPTGKQGDRMCNGKWTCINNRSLSYTSEELKSNYDGTAMAGVWTWDGQDPVTIDKSKWPDYSDSNSFIHSEVSFDAIPANAIKVDDESTISSIYMWQDEDTAYWWSNGWATNLPNDSSSMFKDWTNLTALNLSSMNSNNVTNMAEMFAGCTNLAELNIYSFNTSAVTNVDAMFEDCNKLASVNLGVEFFATTENPILPTPPSENSDGEPLTGKWCKAMDLKVAYAPADMKANWDEATSGGLWIWEVTPSTTVSKELWDLNKNRYLQATSFIKSTISNDENLPQNAVRVDDDTTSARMYVWIDNDKTWYWWSNGLYTYLPADSSELFADESKITSIDLDDFKTDKLTDTHNMFRGCTVLADLSLGEFNTSGVTNMNGMFSGCHELENVAVSTFDTGAVTDMGSMFENCSSLTSLDVDGFTTDQVTNMAYMFGGCSKLESLDVSAFNTSAVTTMASMFSNCSSLTDLNIDGLDTSSTTDMSRMFADCSSLSELDVGHFNVDSVTDVNGMFDGCSNIESLDLETWNTSNVSVASDMFGECDKLSSISMGEDFYNASQNGCEIDIPTPPTGAKTNEGEATGKWTKADNTDFEYTASEVRENWNNTTMPGTWVWQIIVDTYTITFAGGDGATGAMPSQSLHYDIDSAVSPNKFYKLGSEFAGWRDGNDTEYSIGDDGTVVIPANTYSIGDNVTLTAIFVPLDTNVALQDGTLELELKAGEKATFEDLPAGVAYQVYEETDDGWVLVQEDGTSGKIAPTSESEAKFINEYQPGVTNATFYGMVTLDGNPVDANYASFELIENDQVIETVANSDGGAITFTRIDYTAAGTHTYTIRQIASDDQDIKYDNHTETIRVTVAKSGRNALTSEVSMDEDGVLFNNEYRTSDIEIQKSVNGATDANSNEKFKFKVKLFNSDGTPFDNAKYRWYVIDADGNISN